jgi:phosphoribosylformylglycinamidine synthase
MTAKLWSDTAQLDDALSHSLTEQEYSHIRELLGRDLNILELGICAALYSEHCSYKSTKVHLRNLPTEGPQVVQGPGENAGVVDIGDNETVVFKVESHNHPSFIEPFQGAATGVGGIVRDVFTMGARPIALMNGLRFGAISNSRTSYLLQNAVAGIGHYGNCMGIPTVGGELFFHEAYNGNCLVNAFCLGVADKDKIFYGRASGVGNPIFYIGSKTGRDGIKGAVMASESFTENSAQKRPTVQVGDPFQQKLLLEACLEIMGANLVIGIQDMGAAGLTSSSFEMAERAGSGVRLNLELVPQRETGMNPYELMLSESQERMLLAVRRGSEAAVLEICSRWELDAVQIGEVIEERQVELRWNGAIASILPVEVVTAAVPQYRWPESVPQDQQQRLSFVARDVTAPKDLGAVWLKLLGHENSCSRRPVYSQYDSTIRNGTVIHPGGDAAVIRIPKSGVGKRTEKGIAITLDCNSVYCSLDPRQGTALTLAEACRNIAAVGAKPLALSDCLNFGSPQRPEGMWQIAEAIRGLGEASRALGVPIVSGNVSLYNETLGKAVLPTPTLVTVGLMADASKAVGIHFRSAGDKILVLGKTRVEELGGSLYLSAIHQMERGALPILDYDQEIRTADLVRSLINDRLLHSCHDVSQGGLAVALAESCFSELKAIGATISLQGEGALERPDGVLFAESGGRYILSYSPKDERAIQRAIERAGVEVLGTGTVGGEQISVSGIATIALSDSFTAWSTGIMRLFP